MDDVSGGGANGREDTGGAANGREVSGGAANGRGDTGGAANGRGDTGGAANGRGDTGGAANGRGDTGGQAGGGPPQITVFLLDDHELLRRGLRDLLAAEPDISVIGEAGTAQSALRRISALRPDVAVLDVRLPDGDGVSVCREIRSTLPATACLMLTSYGDDQAVLGAIMAGAAGYVLKQTCGSDLVSAVRTVAAGGSTLDAHATTRVMERLRERAASVDPLSALTEQEKRVLELIGEGLTNRQIADRMILSEKTAKNYVSSVLMKLGMQRRAQAAAYVARLTSNQPE